MVRQLDAPRAPATGETLRSLDGAWLACAVLLPGIATLVARLRMTDLAYHVRIGADILATGTIPRVDTYSFTTRGAEWLDQQWGAQVIFELIHRVGGWEGMTVARTLLTMATFLFVFLACRARGRSIRASALLTLGGFVISMVALPMRPQLLALPLLAVAAWIVASREAHPRRMWWLPVIAAVLANVHGSFVVIPLLAGASWLGDVLAKRATARTTLAITGVTLAATLLNPFGFGVWTYAYDLATNPVIRNSITEWQPLDVSDYPGILVFVSVAAFVAYLARRPRVLAVDQLLILGVLLFMALSAQRSIALWGVIAPTVIAASVGSRSAGERADRRGSAGPAILVTASLVVMLLALMPWWRTDRPASLFQDVPLRATEAVRQQLPPGTHLLVHQPWGSWFLFAVPDIPLFLDSRIEIVPQDVWDDYDAVAFAGAEWREALERRDVEAILAKKESWPLIPFLRNDEGWRVTYEDDEAVLFTKVSA
jgi:hypothetical protein